MHSKQNVRVRAIAQNLGAELTENRTPIPQRVTNLLNSLVKCPQKKNQVSLHLVIWHLANKQINLCHHLKSCTLLAASRSYETNRAVFNKHSLIELTTMQNLFDKHQMHHRNEQIACPV